jgi:thiamine pyrophosphokinase
MIIKIFTGPLNYSVNKVYKQDDDEFIIGVDSGCMHLLKSNIIPDLGIGDFDSVSETEYKTIVSKIKNLKTYDRVKDYTDTYLAVKEALKFKYKEIIIYGGIGNRIDHTFANINLLKLGNISLVDETTEMYMLDPGIYTIDNEFKYISFFAIEDVKGLTLKDFKYELEDIDLDTFDPLCISNEGSGTLEFKEGLMLVINQNEE